MSNKTHRQQIARALSAQTGQPYARALQQVTDAAERGLLPARLDGEGQAAALHLLTTFTAPKAEAPIRLVDSSAPSAATELLIVDTPQQPTEARPWVTGSAENADTRSSTIIPIQGAVVSISGHRCSACHLVIQPSPDAATTSWVTVPDGERGCTGTPTPHATALPQPFLGHKPEPVTLHRFDYRYTVFIEDSEIETPDRVDWSAMDMLVGRPPLIDRLLGYCAPIGARFDGEISRAPMAGTDLTGATPPIHPEAPECSRVIIRGSVYATHSAPHAYGSTADYPGSAEQIVEAGSWANGGEFGWEVGCAQFLDIYQPGQEPQAHEPRPL
jgi:hypothetical protein